MIHETVLTNAQIVTADEVVTGTLVLAGGRIKALDPGASSLPAAQDMEGDYLVPGLIEVHTDSLEGYVRPRPGVVWPTLPALLTHDAVLISAGITTVLDALRIGSKSSDPDLQQNLLDAAEGISHAQEHGLLRADHLIHLRCELPTQNVVDHFHLVKDEPLLRLVSLMDHTPGQRQFVDIEQFKLYYGGKHKIKGDAMERFIAEQIEEHRLYADDNRNALAALCRELGLAAASHDDATEAHVEEAAALGLSISEFPTTFEAATAARDKGLATVAGAPNVVRGRSHSGNVSASELAAQGLLDSLSSDYAPISLLHSAFVLNKKKGIPLHRAIAIVTRNPARMVQLDDRGELALGLRADVLRVNEHNGFPVVRTVWREGARMI